MRINLTHLAPLLLLCAFANGCGSSHGLDHDGGLGADGGAGTDAGRVIPDGGSPPPDGDVGGDGGVRGPCDPADARAATCPDALCDGPGSWHWNGDRCFLIDCGACVGADCGSGYSSEADCDAAHSDCDAALCSGTGGRWLFWAEECGHYVCGVAPPADCLVGSPVCDCGPGRAFGPDGCVAADCGDPPPRTREMLCTGTGGTWDSICCDTVCGEYCPAACLASACNCGPGRVFDDERGCIAGIECFERRTGQSCDGVAARCEDGAICCHHFTGAGEHGPPTCEIPVCDGDPFIDECGNDLRAP